MHAHRPERFAVSVPPADTPQAEGDSTDVEQGIFHGQVIIVREIIVILIRHKNASVKNKTTP
jgi:hypothetical protein